VPWLARIFVGVSGWGIGVYLRLVRMESGFLLSTAVFSC